MWECLFCYILLFSFAEIVFVYAAERAYEVIGKILEFCAGFDTVIGIAYSFVIFPSAYFTNIFFHF